ncbi:MAG: glycoside hydrolase family 15 protein [Rhizobiales bacterium]|nr:glycoside hydrolase family 15 protein [Hyphomicrobiales bacterium]
MSGTNLDLAVIGNCRVAALVDPLSRMVWWCFPRFDGDPVFCRLLSGEEEKGLTDVVLNNLVHHESDYVRNSAVVQTTLVDANGSSVRITDFAPRFRSFGRMTKPPQLVRIVEPVSGMPRITIRVRPCNDYGRPITRRSMGSNHITYWGEKSVIRLTTDAPLSYIESEAAFVLTRPMYLVFGTDEPFPSELATTCRDFLARTLEYWSDWVRGLSISYDWQQAIIRAAITLKLSNFEETGGIVAAHTTSIPEAQGSGRNWDYRYCWLRDAYFVVKALSRIGATRTMEDFISFILGVASGDEGHQLKPVYGIVPSDPLAERIAPLLDGYLGNGPVRIGNAAAEQAQHDVYGSIILAALPVFVDQRLARPGDKVLFRFLEPLGESGAKFAIEPDAGIWEYRGRSRVHTYSTAMCWAGCSRLATIARHLGLQDRAQYWDSKAQAIQGPLLERAWNPKRKAFTAAFDSDDLDASCLLLAELGLVEPTDPRFVQTVSAIEKELFKHNNIMRYATADDFGLPETAFLVCRFWLIDAWWSMGRREEARELFVDALERRNHYGLLSEDIDPQTGQLWGNFPQTYSVAGLILSAMRLSRNWEDRYWRS